jgi:hypothetical protein
MSGFGKHIACAVLCVLSSTALMAQEAPVLPAPDAVPQLPVPASFDPQRKLPLSARSASRPTVEVTASVGRTALPDAQRIAIIDFDASLLQAPFQADAAGAAFGSASAPPAAPLELSLPTRRYELAWVSETVDRTNAYRYVTMRVLNVPQGYARFTVTGDQVAGTLVTPQASYRLLSVESGKVAVYSLTGRSNRAKYKRIAEHGSADISSLERRHVQIERLAQIQPKRAFLVDRASHVTIEGGDLGVLTGPVAANTVVSLVQGLSELTAAPADLQVKISRTLNQPEGQRVQFQQLINNVPVYYRNELLLDAAGKVMGLTTNLVDAAWAEDLPIIPTAQAQAAAIREIESLTKAHVQDYELLGATDLSYLLEGPRKLVPYYTLGIRTLADGEIYGFAVNAQSGVAIRLIPPAEFGWRVCDGGPLPPYANPTTCSANARIQWDMTYGAARGCLIPSRPRDGGGGCRENIPLGAHNGMTAANDVLKQVEAYNPGACCDYIGGLDKSVDLVFNTAAQPPPTTLYLPAVGSIVGDYVVSIETVWHEFGHHVLYTGGTKVNWQAVYGQSGREFESAFVEAYGDLMDAVIASNRPVDTGLKNYGDPWIHADGQFANSAARRDLKDPTLTSFSHMSNTKTPHENGRAISKYFYNVKVAANLNGLRLVEFLLVMGREMEDFDHSGGIDLIDLKTAMLRAARPDEPALRDAIEAQFAAMFNNVPVPAPGGTPATPGYPGVPVAPFPITPVFTGCGMVNNARVTNWRVDWSPVPLATKYRSTGLSSVRNWTFESPQPFVDLYTNVNGTVSVQSCNIANICSGPSVSVSVFHQSQCQNF